MFPAFSFFFLSFVISAPFKGQTVDKIRPGFFFSSFSPAAFAGLNTSSTEAFQSNDIGMKTSPGVCRLETCAGSYCAC